MPIGLLILKYGRDSNGGAVIIESGVLDTSNPVP
jgi:hypothetical protein